MVGEDIGRDDLAVDSRDYANDVAGRELALERAFVTIKLRVNALVLINALQGPGRSAGAGHRHRFSHRGPDFILALLRLRLLAYVRQGERRSHRHHRRPSSAGART